MQTSMSLQEGPRGSLGQGHRRTSGADRTARRQTCGGVYTKAAPRPGRVAEMGKVPVFGVLIVSRSRRRSRTRCPCRHQMQLHLAARRGVLASAAADGEHGVALVQERPLDRELAAGERECPPALPGLPRCGAHAEALAGGDLLCVGSIEDRVRESQDVPDRSFLGAYVGDGIRVRVLDEVDCFPGKTAYRRQAQEHRRRANAASWRCLPLAWI